MLTGHGPSPQDSVTLQPLCRPLPWLPCERSLRQPWPWASQRTPHRSGRPRPPPSPEGRGEGVSCPKADSGSLFTLSWRTECWGELAPLMHTQPCGPEAGPLCARRVHQGPPTAPEASAVTATTYGRASGRWGWPLRPCALPASPLTASGPREVPAQGPAQGDRWPRGGSQALHPP